MSPVINTTGKVILLQHEVETCKNHAALWRKQHPGQRWTWHDSLKRAVQHGLAYLDAGARLGSP